MTKLSPAPRRWRFDGGRGSLTTRVDAQKLAIPAPSDRVREGKAFADNWVSAPIQGLPTLPDLVHVTDAPGSTWLSILTAPVHDADLQSALSDLESVVAEAHEEGFPPPSTQALQNAERLLRGMYKLHRCRFEVYPTQDGEVAISVPGGHKRSVLMLCDSSGGALCSVNLSGQHRRAVYDSAAALPDGFVREALVDLRN